MIPAPLTPSFAEKVASLPWHVVPAAAITIGFVALLFWSTNKLMNYFFGPLITYEEEEKDDE